jgi:Transcriptional regulator
MNLELYKFFYYVAKSGNVSKASEQLYVTQPAVSRAIKQLEDELGCLLFFRTSKGGQTDTRRRGLVSECRAGY